MRKTRLAGLAAHLGLTAPFTRAVELVCMALADGTHAPLPRTAPLIGPPICKQGRTPLTTAVGEDVLCCGGGHGAFGAHITPPCPLLILFWVALGRDAPPRAGRRLRGRTGRNACSGPPRRTFGTHASKHRVAGTTCQLPPAPGLSPTFCQQLPQPKWIACMNCGTKLITLIVTSGAFSTRHIMSMGLCAQAPRILQPGQALWGALLYITGTTTAWPCTYPACLPTPLHFS